MPLSVRRNGIYQVTEYMCRLSNSYPKTLSPTCRILLLMRRKDTTRGRVEDELFQGGIRSATCNPELTISTWAILPGGNTAQRRRYASKEHKDIDYNVIDALTNVYRIETGAFSIYRKAKGQVPFQGFIHVPLPGRDAKGTPTQEMSPPMLPSWSSCSKSSPASGETAPSLDSSSVRLFETWLSSFIESKDSAMGGSPTILQEHIELK